MCYKTSGTTREEQQRDLKLAYTYLGYHERFSASFWGLLVVFSHQRNNPLQLVEKRQGWEDEVW